MQRPSAGDDDDDDDDDLQSLAPEFKKLIEDEAAAPNATAPPLPPTRARARPTQPRTGGSGPTRPPRNPDPNFTPLKAALAAGRA